MAEKHILVISQYFYPEQFRINDICQEWVKQGEKVTVLTGIPNYPAGKFYDGYGLFKKRKESWEGIDIIRIPLIPRGHSSVGLTLNYLSFVVSGWFWAHFTRLKPDQVFIYEVSPMTQGLVGVWLAKRRKIPCDIYVTDLWPENVEIITGIHHRAIIAPLERMVKRIYRGCRKIFTSSESFIPAIAKRGVPEEKLRFWPQYAEEFYRPIPPEEVPAELALLPRDERFNILFAGNMGEAQGLGVLVETARLLKEQDLAVRFCMVGDGRFKSELNERIRNAGLEELFCFCDKVPEQTVPYLFAQCDAGLICLAKNDVFTMTLPAKLQSGLACGKPIVVCADGEVQQVIRRADCGVCAPAGDGAALAKAIKELTQKSPAERKTMEERARAFFLEHYEKTLLMTEINKEMEIEGEK